jgi:hypothetical protein
MGDVLGGLNVDLASASQRAIAKQLGIRRDMVAAALAKDYPPKSCPSRAQSCHRAARRRARLNNASVLFVEGVMGEAEKLGAWTVEVLPHVLTIGQRIVAEHGSHCLG